MTHQTNSQKRIDNNTNLLNWLSKYWLIALVSIPLVRVLMLTSFDGSFSQWQVSARLFFLPSLFLEMGIFILAVLNGLNLTRSFGKLPFAAKLALGSWLVILCGATVLSDAIPDLAIRAAMFWITHVLFFAAVAHLMAKSKGVSFNAENFLVILPATSAMVGLLIMLFVFWTGLDSNFNWAEHLPGYANLRHTGYIFAPAIALSLGHLAARPTQSPLIHIGLIIFNTGIMLWLGSRGPVFGLLFGLGVCTLCFHQMRNAQFWIRGSIAMTAAAFLSLMLPIPKDSLFGALRRLWDSSTGEASITSGRLDFWIETVGLISHKPFFGYGAHNFQFVSEHANGMFKHPHQSILQFFFDWGLIGGGLFVFLLSLIAFKSFVSSDCAPHIKLISAMLVSTMFGFSLVDGIFFYPYTIAIFIVFLLWPVIDGQRNEHRSPAS
ncbi:O-antigen ligase family protein [Parasphingorhabdus cellanae]|uniref:O-antigen ligase family protein n=1 Tax=Parasphingorhabdus cellanae TaxID=2806553 RepID=A0ABX7T2U8_9SPHN|nr:O-antigen ligase family protein [Parasphingorhabdus cellanae]QTD55883.1 O-antigen ligase family protein [Parasphingorhabdus cellanae]